MAIENDILKIAEQERQLVFDTFDENRAFEVGTALRKLAADRKLPVVIELRFWDRLLFYAAMPGSTSNNTEWVRRKLNVVKMFHRSTYGMVLSEDRPDRTFKPGTGLSPQDYVLAGGGFPIHVKGVGVVGGIGVSGLPERKDHALIVEVLAAQLKQDAAALALEDEQVSS